MLTIGASGLNTTMPHIYILKSLRDGRYYIGSTNDLKIRMEHHFGGHTPTTKRFGKLELVLTQEYNTLKEARSVERKLKKLKRHDYIEKIIEDKIINIPP